MPFSLTKALIAFPLLFFIPGYVTYRSFIARGEKGDLDFSEGLFIQVLISALLSPWTGLILAELGVFSLPNLLLIMGAYSLALYLALRRRWEGYPRPRFDLYGVFLLGILIIAALLFARPSEQILGLSDAGVYVNIGVNIARTGSILIHDPLLTDMDKETSYQFTLYLRQPRYYLEEMRLPGFYVLDLEKGLIVPQFYHLFPVWIAIFYSILGLPLGLLATPFLGLMGTLGVYFTAKTLFDRRVAPLATLFLVLTAPQIWFSRYPISEMLNQLLIFAAIYALAHFTQKAGTKQTHKWFGIVAGLCLGEIFLARIDFQPLLILISIYLGYLLFARRFKREHWYFFLPIASLLIHSLVHVFFFARAYTVDMYYKPVTYDLLPFLASLWPKAALIVPLLILAVTSCLLTYVYIPHMITWLARRPDLVAFMRRGIAWATIAFIALAGFYAYLIRPGIITSDTITKLVTSPSEALAILAAYIGAPTPRGRWANMVRLGWYTSPLGLLLASMGLFAMIHRGVKGKSVPFLSLALFYSFFFIHDVYANPHFIYTMRRYVPVVLPAFVIFMSYALSWLKEAFPHKVGKMIAIALGAIMLAFFVYTDRVIAGHVEFRGVIDQVGSLASRFDEQDILILSNNRDEPSLIATPLEYIFGKDALIVRPNRPDNEKISALVDRWREKGREVFVIMGVNGGKLFLPGYALIPVDQFTLSWRELEHSYNQKPLNVIPVSLPYGIYKAVPRETVAAEGYPWTLDVGGFDYKYLVGGFWEVEQTAEGVSFRWTSEEAVLRVPWRPGDRPLRLSLCLSGWRPAGSPPLPPITVYLGDEPLAELEVGQQFQVYEILIPPHVAATMQASQTALLRLQAQAWSPSQVGIPDERDLGVRLDWLKIEEVE